MNTAINWITSNQEAFKYVAIICVIGALVLVKDLIFGIHWLRDILIPLIIGAFLAWIYFYV